MSRVDLNFTITLKNPSEARVKALTVAVLSALKPVTRETDRIGVGVIEKPE